MRKAKDMDKMLPFFPLGGSLGQNIDAHAQYVRGSEMHGLPVDKATRRIGRLFTKSSLSPVH